MKFLLVASGSLRFSLQMGGFILFQTNKLSAAAAVKKVKFSPIRNENLFLGLLSFLKEFYFFKLVIKSLAPHFLMHSNLCQQRRSVADGRM